MNESRSTGIRIGTFDGRVGSDDWRGVLTMAESKIELVITDRWVEDSGEAMAEVTASSKLPANSFRLQVELPLYSAEMLVDSYLG